VRDRGGSGRECRRQRPGSSRVRGGGRWLTFRGAVGHVLEVRDLADVHGDRSRTRSDWASCRVSSCLSGLVTIRSAGLGPMPGNRSPGRRPGPRAGPRARPGVGGTPDRPHGQVRPVDQLVEASACRPGAAGRPVVMMAGLAGLKLRRPGKLHLARQHRVRLLHRLGGVVRLAASTTPRR